MGQPRGRPAAAHEGPERTALTQKFSAALASAVTVDAITAAARAGLAAYGANGLIIVTEHEGLQAPLTFYGFGADAARLLGDPAPSPGSPVAHAIAGETAVFVCSAADLGHRYPHLAAVAAGSAHQAWAAVPVPDARGRLGACLMGFAGPREFGTEERALLVAASGLLAQSLQRARMHESEHALARDLQHGLLPRGPLQAPGMTIAARYQPVTSGLEIGGDFYDAIELTGGRVALVIGDVQGHNPIAASLMGRLRMVVHAYAREGHGPAEVMTRANQWLVELNTDPDLALFASCCFVVIHPAAGELEMCRAGHPAPVLVSPGAAPVLLDQGDDLLLGVERAERYSTVKALDAVRRDAAAGHRRAARRGRRRFRWPPAHPARRAGRRRRGGPGDAGGPAAGQPAPHPARRRHRPGDRPARQRRPAPLASFPPLPTREPYSSSSRDR